MSLDWRQRRRALYIGIPILVMFLIAGFMTWRALNSVSCTNGRQDGGELGIDCEGPCPKLCESRIEVLTVEWVRFVEVEHGRYNVMALINNENEDLAANALPYTLTLFSGADSVWEESGETVVPAGKKFAVFEGPISLATTPTRATITLDQPSWQKVENVPVLEPLQSTFSELETSPELEVVVRNTDVSEVRKVEVAVALYDDDKNTVHVSRTVIDSIGAQSQAPAFFTWPRPFGISQGVCAEPFTTVLAIDRSGSMNEDSLDPPEPLGSVKEAALSFTDQIGADDQAGLVTFATEASQDSELVFGKTEIQQAIREVVIRPEDEEGYTNIGDALKIAREMLVANTDRVNRSIVLLTDGRANWPEMPTGEAYAQSQAQSVRADGISLYAIGLGSNVGSDFLNILTGDSTRVFQAPTPENLYSIYQEIGTRLCDREPFFVEVYTKRLNGET